LLTTDSLIKV